METHTQGEELRFESQLWCGMLNYFGVLAH